MSPHIFHTFTDKPRFASNHTTEVHGWAGSTRNITCQATGQPDPVFKWALRDQVLTNNGTFTIDSAGSSSNLLVSEPFTILWP